MPTDGTAVSKSQRKREHAAVQALAERIADLPAAAFDALPLDDDVRAELAAARPLQRAARRRQLRYASQRLARVDVAALEAALEVMARPAADSVRAFHQAEHWRDRLLAGDDGALDEIASRYPAFDRAAVAALVVSARHEQARGARPRAARELFRSLRALVDAGGAGSG